MASSQDTDARDAPPAPAPPPVASANLFAELGLAPEDVDALAQIPENEISIETLPFLIMQLKAKKAGLPVPTATKSAGDAPSRRRDSASSTGPSHHNNSAPPTGPSSSTPKSGRPLSGATKGHGDPDGGHRGHRETKAQYKSLRGKWYPDGKPKLPYSYQVSDFHGNVPHTFPHTCTLCHCKVNSKTTWKDHLHGVRHETSRKGLLRLFPNWNPHQQGPSSLYPNDTDRRPGRSLKRQVRIPDGPIPSSDMPATKRPLSGPMKPPQRPYFRSRVVVTKFPLGSVTVRDLLELAEPFGTVVKHLVFPTKGFLEFSSHMEAHAMVSHFYDKLDFTKQHKIYIYLSPTVLTIQIPGGGGTRDPSRSSKSGTVLFSRLPDNKITQEKVLEVVRMFGEYGHCKFSGSEAHVEMVDREDARVMVKYYHYRSLKLLGSKVRVTMLPDPNPKHLQRDSPERSQSGSWHKSEESNTLPSSAAAAKDKREDGTDSSAPPNEKAGEDAHVEEKQAKGGPRGEASQPDAEWAELREEDLDPEDVEEVELGDEEEEVDGGEHGNDEEDGIPVEDEQGLLEEAEDDLEDSVEVTETPDPEEGVEPSERDNPEQALGDEDNQEEEMSNFPENLDDFVTLDELDSGTDMIETNDFQGGKVVLIRPVKGYPPEEALRKLAAPFGKVVNHTVSRYRQEALLQLESEEQVKEMVAFYRAAKESSLINGRPVTVSLCRSLKELEGPSGRSIYISNLPMGKFSDISLLWMARPFGPIKAYRINRGPRSCYIQFNSPEGAEKMLKKYATRPPKFRGSLLTVCPCRKPDSTISWIMVSVQLGRPDRVEEEENGDEERERRSSKRRREDSVELEGPCGDPPTAESEEKMGSEDADDSVYPSGTPVGLDYIVATSGFFCKLCNVFYTSETTARTQHCSSTQHHRNLKSREKRRRLSSPPKTDPSPT